MVRVAKPIDYNKLKYLKEKINDKSYISDAVSRIAQTLTNELLNVKNDKNEPR